MLAGGLGNQMFQYAAGRALALRHGTELMLDLAPFRKGQFEVERPFELDRLRIEVAPSTDGSALSFLLARRPARPLQRLGGWRTARERSLAYDPAFASLPDRTFLMGYWQSWRYFQDHADHIAAELQPQAPLSDASERVRQRAATEASVSLHVRRGDYVTSSQVAGFHGVLPLEYYAQALSFIQERVENMQVYVFSDDLDWCRRSLGGLGLAMSYVDCNQGADSWQDLYVMAACRHSIVANSSFSWWGAWFGDRSQRAPGRTVVAPRHWFSGADVPIEDRAPPEWKII